MNLFELVAKIGMDTSEFEQGVSKIKGLFSNLGSTVSAGTVAMGNLMAKGIEKGVNAIMDLGRTGLAYNAQMEDYTTNFAVMLGSTEAAAQRVESLKEMAAKTPFEMSDLAAATQTLLAFGIEAENTDSIMKMLGDVSLGNSQKFSSLATVFGQVSSTGKLMGQDLNQFINQGFNPLQVIAEKTGASVADLKNVMGGTKTSREFQKMVKAAQKEVKKMGDGASESAKLLAQIGTEGAISADMVTKAFEIATEEGGQFYNGMEAASKTQSGLLATLSDNYSALVGKVFKPANDFLTNTLIPSAIGAVDRLSAAYDAGGIAGLLGEGGKILSTLASSLIENAPTKFGTAGQSIANAIVEAINTTFGTNIPEFTTLDEAISNSLTNAKSFTTDVLQWISDNGAAVSTALGLIAVGFTGIKIAADPLGITIGLLLLGFGVIVTNWETVKKSVGTGLETLKTDFNTAMTQLDTDYGTAWDSMKDWFHYTFGLDLPDWETLKDDISSGWQTVASGISGFFTATFEVLTQDDARAKFSVDTAEKISTWWAGVGASIAGLFSETFGIELLTIEETTQSIKDWWAQAKASVGDIFFETFGINLPTGEEIAQNIRDWWAQTEASVGDIFFEMFGIKLPSIEEVAQSIKDWWMQTQTSVGDIFFETFGIKLPTVEEVAQSIKDWWASVKTSVGDFFLNIGAKIGFSEKDTGGRSFAVGLDYVPKNNYVASLHRGEAVLTRTEADAWRSGKTARGNVTVVQNIYAQEKTAADLMQEAMWQQERAVLYGV